MGVVLGVFLDRLGGPAIRVAFAQNRVHGRSLDCVIARTRHLFVVGLRVLGVIGQCVSLGLQFGNGRNKLRHRGRDIGQFDHVRIWRLHQFAKRGKVIALALVFAQMFGEGGDDAACQRNVAGSDGDSGGGGKGLNDRKERGRGQFGCFVNLGVDDIGRALISHV